MNSLSIQDIHTWYWLLVTPEGIYHGEVEGVLERGDTQEKARQDTARIVIDMAQKLYNLYIFACVVSDSPITTVGVNAEEKYVKPLNLRLL